MGQGGGLGGGGGEAEGGRLHIIGGVLVYSYIMVVKRMMGWVWLVGEWRGEGGYHDD